MGAEALRLGGASSGAVLGALIWVGFKELGVWGVLKFQSHAAVFVVVVVVCAVAGGIPLMRRGLWAAAALTAVLLAVVALTPLAHTLTRSMVRVDPAPAGKLDAVVVLSGGVTADNRMLSQTLDRLLKGLEVVRDGRASALVLSRETLMRSGRIVSDSADEAGILSLVGVQVPVYFIDAATSTRDEALRVNALTERSAWKRIGLVTSPLHTRRACAVFERVGFAVTCIPSDSRESSVRNLDTVEDRLHAFQGWLYETAGATDYRMKGWI